MNQGKADRTSVLSFEATCVPRFEREELGQREIESISSHQTLWSGIQELLHLPRVTTQSPGTSATFHEPIVELCFVADAVERKCRLLFNLRNVNPTDEKVGSIVDALPPDYKWKTAAPLETIFRQAGLGADGSKVFNSRVERRLSFMDLPWRRLTAGDRAGVQAGESSEFTDTTDDGQRDETRRLLTRPLSPGQLQNKRFCVPLTGVIESKPHGLRLLFQEMRLAAPSAVTFSVVPVDAKRLDAYRRIAVLWNSFFQAVGADVANAGFADIASLRAQYDRFLLPDEFLCELSFGVWARTAMVSRSLALHLTSRLGGVRSFIIRGATQLSTEAATDPWMNLPHKTRWPDKWWNAREERMRRELLEEGIDLDHGQVAPLFRQFLIELPHMYTFAEAAAVAALPVSDEEGLPGFETRLIVPFNEPSQGGSWPYSLEPPRDRLRIGITSSSANANEAKGDWHTISTNDLTKHALVVGSTGSGKTVATLFIARELGRARIPFLIIEPVKTEYFDNLCCIEGLNLRRIRLEGTPGGDRAENFLSFDPMRLQEGVSVARHASYLKSCFEAAFPMPENSPESMILEAGIREYYTSPLGRYGCGLKMFTRGGPMVHRADVHVYIEQWNGDADEKSPVKTTHQILPYGRPVSLAPGQKRSPKFKDEIFVTPSLRGFRKFLFATFLPKIVSQRTDMPSKNLTELLETWRQFFERRFEALMSGMIGFASVKADEEFLAEVKTNPKKQDSSITSRYNPFSDLVTHPTVLELDGIPDDQQKALMMAFITSFLFEMRQAEDLARRERREAAESTQAQSDKELNDRSDSDRLRHVLIIEEAHRILANSNYSTSKSNASGAQAKSVSVFVEMLAEIRAFGQGIIIVEQIPTKIVPEAVKNTNLKIMLRLTAADDREFLGAAMNFTDEQKRFVTSLKAEQGRGVDFVVFEQQLDQPRLLMLPLTPKREQPIHERLFRWEAVS